MAKKVNTLRSTTKPSTAGEDEESASGSENGESEGEVENVKSTKKAGRMGVDAFMGGGFVDGMADEASDGEGDEDDGDEEQDDASLQDVEDLSDEEGDHVQDLAKLAKKDPEFFNYLQENDQELLDFGNEDEEDEEEMEEPSSPVKKGKKKATEKEAEVVTSEMLKGWQKSILKVSSLIESIRCMGGVFANAFLLNRLTHLKHSEDCFLLSERLLIWETKKWKNLSCLFWSMMLPSLTSSLLLL